MVELQASTSLQIEGCRDDEGFGDRIYTYIVVTHLNKTIVSFLFELVEYWSECNKQQKQW